MEELPGWKQHQDYGQDTESDHICHFGSKNSGQKAIWYLPHPTRPCKGFSPLPFRSKYDSVVCGCKAFILCCIQTVYKTNWIIAEHILMKTKEISTFLKELRTSHDLGFVSDTGNIFSSWKRNIKNHACTADFMNHLLVETYSLSFCSNELLTFSCVWPSAGNGFH